MSDQHVPAPRWRFLEDMRIKGVQPKTQTMCLRAMGGFTRFPGRSPDTATPEELRAFQLDMSEKGTGSATSNNRLGVLGFFSVTCAREEMKRHMRYRCLAKKTPIVLSAEEVTRILDAAPGPGLKYRAAFVARACAAQPGPRSASLLPVKVLSRLFRRPFLEGSVRLHEAGEPAFFGDLSEPANAGAFAAHLVPLRKADWVAHAKPPFGGPEAVLAYPNRYIQRVAISNTRCVSADAGTVAFRWKDCRIERGDRMKVMRLPTFETIRRFPVHVLLSGFHRTRHYGVLANGIRHGRIEKIRRLMDAEPEADRTAGEDGGADPDEPGLRPTCPGCGGAMIVIETFTRGQTPKSRAPPWENAA